METPATAMDLLAPTFLVAKSPVAALKSGFTVSPETTPTREADANESCDVAVRVPS